MDWNGILISSTCLEQRHFRPVEGESTGAVTTVSQSIKFLQKRDRGKYSPRKLEKENLLLYLCYVFRALINSLVCLFVGEREGGGRGREREREREKGGLSLSIFRVLQPIRTSQLIYRGKNKTIENRTNQTIEYIMATAFSSQAKAYKQRAERMVNSEGEKKREKEKEKRRS